MNLAGVCLSSLKESKRGGQLLKKYLLPVRVLYKVLESGRQRMNQSINRMNDFLLIQSINPGVRCNIMYISDLWRRVKTDSLLIDKNCIIREILFVASRIETYHHYTILAPIAVSHCCLDFKMILKRRMPKTIF